MAVQKIKTYDEAHSLIQGITETLHANKGALVRLLVPQPGLKGEREAKQEWVADLVDDLSEFDARLLDAASVFEGMELVKAAARKAAPSKPAKAPAKAAPKKPAASRGSASKAASARVKGSNGAPRTKGGAKKVTATGATPHDVKPPATAPATAKVSVPA